MNAIQTAEVTTAPEIVAETPKPKKSKKKPVAKKTAPATKPEATARDKFGSHLNTRAATINAILIRSKKPLSAKEIAEKSGANAVRNHLLFLERKGMVKKTKDGLFAKK